MGKFITFALIISAFSIGFFASGDQIKIEEKPEPPIQYMHVDFSGDMYVGRYHFHFKENMSDNRVGYTYPNDPRNDIFIETDRSGQTILNTCRHEVLHHYFPDYRHGNTPFHEDPIYRLEDNVEFGVCQQLMRRLQKQA